MKNRIVVILSLLVLFALFFACAESCSETVETKEVKEVEEIEPPPKKVPLRVVTKRFYENMQKQSGFDKFKFVISKDITFVKLDDPKVSIDKRATTVKIDEKISIIDLSALTSGRMQRSTIDEIEIAFEEIKNKRIYDPSIHYILENRGKKYLYHKTDTSAKNYISESGYRTLINSGRYKTPKNFDLTKRADVDVYEPQIITFVQKPNRQTDRYYLKANIEKIPAKDVIIGSANNTRDGMVIEYMGEKYEVRYDDTKPVQKETIDPRRLDFIYHNGLKIYLNVDELDYNPFTDPDDPRFYDSEPYLMYVVDSNLKTDIRKIGGIE